ncbi:MAG TPA: hypothetical protein VF185_03295 [Patescibacteria group bacterium]
MNKEREIKIDTIAKVSIGAILIDFVMIATGKISPVAGITMLAPVAAALMSMHDLNKTNNRK